MYKFDCACVYLLLTIAYWKNSTPFLIRLTSPGCTTNQCESFIASIVHNRVQYRGNDTSFPIGWCAWITTVSV